MNRNTRQRSDLVAALPRYGMGFLQFVKPFGFARTLAAVIIAHAVIFSPVATSRRGQVFPFSAGSRVM